MNTAFLIAKKIFRSENKENNISLPAVKIGAIAVGTGICIMILSVAVIRGFKHQITYKLKSLTSDVVIMPYQTSYDITSNSVSVSEDTLEILRKTDVIANIEPVCIKNGILKIKEENEGVVFKGVSYQYNWNLLRPYLTEGRFPEYKDTITGKEIVISKKLADKMQIKLNQKIIIYFIVKNKDIDGNEKIDYRSRDFLVSGVIHPQMGELDNQLIYGDARVIQKINNWNNFQFSQIELYAKQGISGNKIIEKIIDILPYNYKLLTAEDLYSNIFNWLEMIDINAVIIIVLMLMVASVNMVSALIILILEKVTLIGVLKAIGMNDTHIKNIFLFVSMKILSWGLIVGNLLALSLMLLQQQFHLFKLDAEAYYVDSIPIEWRVYDWILLNSGTVLICLVFMYIPTYLITKMSPSQILRWE